MQAIPSTDQQRVLGLGATHASRICSTILVDGALLRVCHLKFYPNMPVHGTHTTLRWLMACTEA